MVANGFGIGRTNADVDQGDPRTIRCDEMVCWHLVATPSAVGDQLRRIVRWRVDIQAASTRQSGIAAVADLLAGPTDEFVDITVIVGEQDIVLNMFSRRTCVMAKSGERKVRT